MIDGRSSWSWPSNQSLKLTRPKIKHGGQAERALVTFYRARKFMNNNLNIILSA